MNKPSETIALKQSVPVRGEYDVIVVGGGPSGCTAAAASAREGKRTLLIESTAALGGMGTMGLVPGWCPFSDQEKIIYRGLAEEVFRKSRAALPHDSERVDWVGINAEVLKRVYDDLVTSAGAKVLFQTTLCGVFEEKGRVSAVLTANKSGLSAYNAKVFVDCTGDADLAVQAGAQYESGDGDGLVQPSTHCFVLGNTDIYAYLFEFRWTMGGPAKQLRNDPELDLITDNFVCTDAISPDAVGFNAGHIYELDSGDPEAVSAALIQGRKMAEQFCKGLRKYAPAAFGNAYVAQTGALMGVRESRRVLCDYNLTAEDYAARRSFPDEIGRSSYCVDTHPTSKDREKGVEPSDRYETYKAGESFGIPYRSLSPVGLANVLVAGRCIGSDHAVNGSVRVMPPCLVTGEAAGAAAAQAAAMELPDIHRVDVSALQESLLRRGAYLHIDQA